MAWLRAQEREVLETFLRKTDHHFLASKPDGTCLWANEAFLTRMKYTESELTGYRSSQTGEYVAGKDWTAFTVPDENLEADIQAVRELEEGKRTEYHCKKQYIPKGSAPEDVMIQVLRFPQDGGKSEFKFCLVSVFFLDDAREMSMAAMMESMTQMFTQITTIVLEIQERLARIEVAKNNNQTEIDEAILSVKRVLAKIPKRAWWAIFWSIVGFGLTIGGADAMRALLDVWETVNG